jgi:hypothetical protein
MHTYVHTYIGDGTSGAVYIYKQSLGASPGQYENHWNLVSKIPSVTGYNSYFGISVDFFK